MDGFARHLREAGYRHGTGRDHVRGAAHLGCWLEARGVPIRCWDEAALDRFERHLSRCRCGRHEGGTGLRISEALNLRFGDITPDGLIVRATKFRKSRLIPLHQTVVVGLERYLEHRLRAVTQDEEIERREFQIAVVVFEKLQALLVARPQLVEAVGLVVVDELQLITDETRGPTLEILLTKLRIAGSRPRIVGLSAVLGRAQLLSDWLGARLLVDTRRPVELRKGVLCRGTFAYREHNSGAQGTESFADCESEKRPDLIVAAAEELAQRGEQVLVFVPDRASTVTFARVLAGRVRLPALEAALEKLREQEETHARDALREVPASSIAFHNSDLSPEERDLVERHFRSGGIRALFSTSTLAMGMNLPVKNVVLDGKRWQYLRRYGR